MMVSLLKAAAGTQTLNKVISMWFHANAAHDASKMKTISFSLYVSTALALHGFKIFSNYAGSMHKEIRDDRYLVGVTLNNS
jgi:hypothetical protein